VFSLIKWLCPVLNSAQVSQAMAEGITSGLLLNLRDLKTQFIDIY
jgi:hypothetical protein